MTYDIIIIGAGPAGVSAALYAKRANLSVAVIYSGESQLEKAHKIDNYYGFPDGITGSDLYKNGIQQAKNLGIEVIEAEVTHIEMLAPPPQTQYSVKAGDTELTAQAIILATGNKKLRPPIEGILDFEGKGGTVQSAMDFSTAKRMWRSSGTALSPWLRQAISRTSQRASRFSPTEKTIRK